MLTANLNPAASNPPLFSSMKPVVEDVQNPKDRLVGDEQEQSPAMGTQYPVDAFAGAENIKAETQKPAEPPQSEPASTQNLASKGYTQVEKITAEQASGNILAFVRQGLAEAASRGKSQEELQTMLNQARQGVEEGFALAIAELKALGLIGDELVENIQTSREMVESGIDELETQMLNQTSLETSAQAEPLLPQPLGGLQGAPALEHRMALQLTTREGDVITLHWGHAQFQSPPYKQAGVEQTAAAASLSSGQLSYSIVGDINDQERAELETLLQASFDFAAKFFNDRNDQIMEQVSAYVETFKGLDTLSGLDLHLTQTKTRPAAAYGQVAELTSEFAAEGSQVPELMPKVLLDELKTLKGLADQLLADQTDLWPWFQSLADVTGAESTGGQSFLQWMDSLFGRLGVDTSA